MNSPADQERAAAWSEHNQPQGARTPRACGDAGGMTKAGTPCRSVLNLSPATGKCLMHDETRATERASMRSAGGAAAKVARTKGKAADPVTVPPRMKTLADAVAMASWITNAVMRGEVEARTAESATKACRQFQLGEEKATLLKRIK